MNALPSSAVQPDAPPSPSRSGRPAGVSSSRPLDKPNSPSVQQHRLFTATGKLALYSFLSVLSITSLVNLLGYSWAQQGKLQQLRSEVKDAQQRVAAQSDDFQNSFDPHGTKTLMQENSYRVPANQQPIVLYNRDAKLR